MSADSNTPGSWNQRILDLECKVKDLQAHTAMLEDAIIMLTCSCNCTIAERQSGHHVDCPVPQVQSLLSGGRSND